MTVHQDDDKIWIVGLGASAGGLMALEAFFQNCPTDTGMAFVVIQHLSPDFKSLMEELLSRHTRMPVRRVNSRVPIQPNCVYLISPKKNLSVVGDELIPTEQDATKQPRLPIDFFFSSLAQERGPRAIAIVLSGSGSDGSRGCRDVKNQGGTVIAQSPETCGFSSMPTSVIDLNLADQILPPEEIPVRIVEYLSAPIAGVNPVNLNENLQMLHRIHKSLQGVEGVDFTDYRYSTIERRIERRMKAIKVESLQAYVEILEKDINEARVLHSDLLIGVTCFFRDRETWDYLRTSVFPRILSSVGPGEVVRIWSAGCSSGEEAYSLAMIALECIEEQKEVRDIKIFATDIDRSSLDKAAMGRFSENIAEELSAERLKRFFTKMADGYQIRPEVRRVLNFSFHDLVKNPPFTKLNLICCRNLLIYFQARLQIRALSLFRFGLLDGGFLFLGKSESLGSLTSEFVELGQGHNIFEKISSPATRLSSAVGIGDAVSSVKITASQSAHLSRSSNPVQPSTEAFLTQIYDSLLSDFVSNCMVVDEEMSLLHIFGDATNHLKLSAGRSSLNVLKMMDENVALSCSTAVSRAKELNKEVVLENVIPADSDQAPMTLRVKPVRLGQFKSRLAYAIFFELKNADSANSEREQISLDAGQANAQVQRHVAFLESELERTRDTLQQTIEELETTNEELQSTNEELMSSNEELQSSNEELQSVNEELHTVNYEHQIKIAEVTRTNNDIDFLLKSSSIGMVFLDRHLRIRRFNSVIQSTVNVRDQDIWREITEITFNFAQEQIMELVRTVSATMKPLSCEAQHEGKTFHVSAVPYNPEESSDSDDDEDTSGLVLSLTDVTHLKEVDALKRLTVDSEQFNYIVSHDLHKPLRSLKRLVCDTLKTAESPDNQGCATLLPTLQEAKRRTNTLESMLDAVLEYSRTRTRGGTFEGIPANEFFREFASDPEFSSAKFHFSNLPSSIWGDRHQLKGLFVQLFRNAVQNEDPKRNMVIEVSAHSNGSIHEIHVRDNGVGFPECEEDKKFEIFRTLDLTDPSGKIGAGLALCKRIVERHNGKIRISANESFGTTAVVSLPDSGSPLF